MYVIIIHAKLVNNAPYPTLLLFIFLFGANVYNILMKKYIINHVIGPCNKLITVVTFSVIPLFKLT